MKSELGPAFQRIALVAIGAPLVAGLLLGVALADVGDWLVRSSRRALVRLVR